MQDLERRRLLESEIERRLDEHFASLRGELERLRAESEGRWGGFSKQLEQRLEGLVPPELLAIADEPSPLGHVSAAVVRELDHAATQVEILNRLLENCLRHASRAILLVFKDGAWSVWKGVGSSCGADEAEELRKVTLTEAQEGLLARVREGAPSRFAPGNEVSARLLCPDAAEVVVVPMTVGEKISGALYADATAQDVDRFNPDSIALLAYLAGLLIDRLGRRRLRPSPALREIERDLWQPTGTPAAAPRSASGERRPPGPPAPAGEDERYIEARRFAELLVSEIKLYNERAVREGREEGNLYKRLKGEIDLSRQVYEQKFPEAARAGSDFLREELVRILADGRPEALGM